MRIIIAIIIALIFFMVASPFSRINFVRIISPIFPSVNSRIAKNDGKKRCKIGISNGICVINTAAGGGISCQTKRKGSRSQSGAALGFRFAAILYADKKARSGNRLRTLTGGAGNGNRTRLRGLGSRYSTDELCLQKVLFYFIVICPSRQALLEQKQRQTLDKIRPKRIIGTSTQQKAEGILCRFGK